MVQCHSQWDSAARKGYRAVCKGYRATRKGYRAVCKGYSATCAWYSAVAPYRRAPPPTGPPDPQAKNTVGVRVRRIYTPSQPPRPAAAAVRCRALAPFSCLKYHRSKWCSATASGTVPHVRGTVPYASGTVPYARGTVPYARGTVPHVRGTVPWPRTVGPRPLPGRRSRRRKTLLGLGYDEFRRPPNRPDPPPPRSVAELWHRSRA